MIDFSLTEEQNLIQKVANRFAKEYLLPGAIDRDENSTFPKDNAHNQCFYVLDILSNISSNDILHLSNNHLRNTHKLSSKLRLEPNQIEGKLTLPH